MRRAFGRCEERSEDAKSIRWMKSASNEMQKEMTNANYK